MNTADAIPTSVSTASAARPNAVPDANGNTPASFPDLFARADEYWAALLGCDTRQLTQNARWVNRASDETMLAALWRAGAWKVRFPRQLTTKQREHLLHALEAFTAVADPLPRNAQTAQAAYDALRHELLQGQPDPHKRLEECVWGPAELLYFNPAQARLAASVDHRPLTQADQEQAARFRALMVADGQQMVWTVTDLPASASINGIAADISADWPYMIGVFDEDQLIAVSAIRNWAGSIAEVFTDILPDYRTQGIGTRISSDLIRWTLENTSLLIQSDADWMNVPSRHISRQLGFQFYGMLIMSDISA